MVLARCAAASHEEPKTVTPAVGDNWADEPCKLCKQPVGEHSGTQLSDCLDAIRALKEQQVKRVLGSPAKLDVTNDGHVIVTEPVHAGHCRPPSRADVGEFEPDPF